MFFFALDEDFGGAKDDLGAARGRDEAPLGEGALGSVHGSVYIGLGGFLKDADYFARVGGIAVFEGFSGRGVDPLAVNEVLEYFGLRAAESRGGSEGVGGHDCS